MKPFTNAGILAGSAVLLLSAAAAAQGQPAPATPAPAPAPATTPATAPVAATPATTDATAGGTTTVAVGTEATAQADATATPVAEPEPKPEPVPEPMPEPTPEPEAAPEPAKSPFSFSVFVDANYAIQSSQEGTLAPNHRAYEGSRAVPTDIGDSADAYPSYDLVNDTGFGIALAGTDLAYDGGTFGATVSLRFGNAMQNYHFNTVDGATQGTIPLTQAYATWKPMDTLTVDLGMFYTIFGAEVLETWRNLTYSRSGLYFAMQPFWHTGLRAALQVNDSFGLKLLVVNDTNTSWNYQDPNANAPVVGLQAAITPTEAFSLYVGGMIAEDGVFSGFETFGDLLAIVKLGGFTGILNGDVNYRRNADVGFGGLSLTLGYQFTPMFGMAFREDLLIDPQVVLLGTDIVQTHTLTFDVRPIVDVANLVLRAEGRIDNSPNGQIFTNDIGAGTAIWGLGLISMVVNTDGL